MISIILAIIVAASNPDWQDGVAVQLAGSHVELTSIGAASAFDMIGNSIGPTYYNDCATLVNSGETSIKHLQVVFAMVDATGVVKQAEMPLDFWFKTGPLAANVKSSDCRRYAYSATNRRGQRLIAWVSTVDFVDGTAWQAPSADQMISSIVDAFPKTTPKPN